MRDHTKHIEVNRFEAEKIILENCNFTQKTEKRRIQDAIGYVLAEDAAAQWDYPTTLTCKMDSVAVRWADFENGMPDTSDWKRGSEWEFGNTGVAMPEGYDTAIVVEHVIFSDGDTKIAFDAMPSGKFAGTTAPGSKMKKGQVLCEKGTMITPLLAAHIASGNIKEVTVIRKPRVVFIPTGNELKPIGSEDLMGKNIESNSVMLAEKIRQWGGEPVVFDIVPDDRELIKAALLKAAEEGDIIVLNAGSSKGNDDWGIEMLEEVGKIFYHQTNHGPGHHSSFGLIGSVPVVGISGPPGGAAFTADFYVYPAVRKYLCQDPSLKRIKVRLGEDFKEKKKFMPEMAEKKPAKAEDRPNEGGEFYSVRQVLLKVNEEGIVEAYPLKGGGHPAVTDAETAGAYYLKPAWDGGIEPEKGSIIEVELRP